MITGDERLSTLQDKFESQIVQVMDMQRIMDVLGYGFEYLAEDNGEYMISSLREMKRYLEGLHESLSEDLELLKDAIDSGKRSKDTD